MRAVFLCQGTDSMKSSSAFLMYTLFPTIDLAVVKLLHKFFYILRLFVERKVLKCISVGFVWRLVCV